MFPLTSGYVYPKYKAYNRTKPQTKIQRWFCQFNKPFFDTEWLASMSKRWHVMLDERAYPGNHDSDELRKLFNGSDPPEGLLTGYPLPISKRLSAEQWKGWDPTHCIYRRIYPTRNCAFSPDSLKTWMARRYYWRKWYSYLTDDGDTEETGFITRSYDKRSRFSLLPREIVDLLVKFVEHAAYLDLWSFYLDLERRSSKDACIYSCISAARTGMCSTRKRKIVSDRDGDNL